MKDKKSRGESTRTWRGHFLKESGEDAASVHKRFLSSVPTFPTTPPHGRSIKLEDTLTCLASVRDVRMDAGCIKGVVSGATGLKDLRHLSRQIIKNVTDYYGLTE